MKKENQTLSIENSIDSSGADNLRKSAKEFTFWNQASLNKKPKRSDHFPDSCTIYFSYTFCPIISTRVFGTTNIDMVSVSLVVC